MSITGTVQSREMPSDSEILELTNGENPVRFLASTEALALAMINGIQDLNRLEAYRLAEKRYIDRSNSTRIHRALDAREQVLRGDDDPDPDPLPGVQDPTPDAVDNGEEEETPREEEGESEPSPELPDRHLAPGTALVIPRRDKTEYIWPVRGTDPYLSRAYNEDDSLWMEIHLNDEQMRDRLAHEEAATVNVEDLPDPIQNPIDALSEVDA